MRTRAAEHEKSKASPVWEHVNEEHGGKFEGLRYQWNVTEEFLGDSLGRQLSEALEIRDNEGELINKKEEFHSNVSTRLSANRISEIRNRNRRQDEALGSGRPTREVQTNPPKDLSQSQSKRRTRTSRSPPS